MDAQLAQLRANNDAMAAQLAKMEANGRAEAMARSLTALGVKPQYHEIAPANIDPRTPEGKAALEKWAADRPEIRTASITAPAPPPNLLTSDKKAHLRNSPLYNEAHLRANAKTNGVIL